MTRKVCQDAIKAKLREIVDVYLRYNPDGKYLNLFYLDGNIAFNNADYDDKTPDFNLPVSFFGAYKEGEKE